MSSASSPLGLGIGWRPELADLISRRGDLGFVEILAEDFFLSDEIPPSLTRLHDAGVRIVPHGVGLSLGGAEPICPARVDALGHLAQLVQAPLVSEHIAFVRAGGLETGHLLPVPRTRAMLEILIENVHLVEADLPVPLALENISALFDWPGAELDEAAFLSELLARTEAMLLLDLENIYANTRNLGGDPVAFLEKLPLDRVGYVHLAGGRDVAGVYHDTHTEPIPDEVFALLQELCARNAVPGVLLERDGQFPGETALDAELEAIKSAMEQGQARRVAHEFAYHS